MLHIIFSTIRICVFAIAVLVVSQVRYNNVKISDYVSDGFHKAFGTKISDLDLSEKLRDLSKHVNFTGRRHSMNLNSAKSSGINISGIKKGQDHLDSRPLEDHPSKPDQEELSNLLHR